MTMNRKQLAAALALTAGVAGGGLAGAMLGTPSVSSAVESIGAQEDGGGPGPRAHVGHRLDLAVAAEAIGITEDELRAALEDGQSIAEVAEANGADVEAVIDALVADATAAIDEAVAAGDLDAERAEEIKAGLEERITAAVNGEGPFGGPGGPGHRHRHPLPGLEVAAETIGITVEELRTALVDGQSVAEVAEANGVDPQAVIDALVEHATERITDFVNGEDG
jgi:hypothetical protein